MSMEMYVHYIYTHKIYTYIRTHTYSHFTHTPHSPQTKQKSKQKVELAPLSRAWQSMERCQAYKKMDLWHCASCLEQALTHLKRKSRDVYQLCLASRKMDRWHYYSCLEQALTHLKPKSHDFIPYLNIWVGDMRVPCTTAILIIIEGHEQLSTVFSISLLLENR